MQKGLKELQMMKVSIVILDLGYGLAPNEKKKHIEKFSFALGEFAVAHRGDACLDSCGLDC